MKNLFLACCVIIVVLAALALSWAEKQGPPAECYSFTNIKAEPWHQMVCVPVLVVVAIAVVLDTLRKLGGG